MITLERLEEIQEAIEDNKEKKAKAEGNMENIEKQWKEKYNCDSPEEAQTKAEELTEEIQALKIKKAELETEIEAAADWDELI